MMFCLAMQTAPEHTLPVLDKYLHEISITDGVLEIKNEHFWTISFGSLVRRWEPFYEGTNCKPCFFTHRLGRCTLK